jgi:uncharacterized surface protein with fasciclin (FAS1) repeats
MKFSFLKYLLICFITTTLISCDKDDDSKSDAPTIDAYLQANPQLSMFSAAINKAGLESFKTGPGPFTWFAPTNEAFIAAGVTQDSLNKMTPGQVNYLILYHMINADFTSRNMIAVNSAPRTTQLGTPNQVYYGNVNEDSYVNGIKITSKDNVIANGRVHVINSLLIPPPLRGTVASILASTGQHTLFIQALTRANLFTSTTLASTTAVFTVFAPTDAAMTAAGYTSASIAAATPTSLAAVMRYHYISNTRLFTNDLNRTTTPPTAVGSAAFLTTSENGTKLKGKNNSTPVNITRSNILGTNGVVHVIDGVLRP